MARAMFEYTKTVLDKVSFDPTLFCREVKKALQRLLPHEIEELRIWIMALTNKNPELNQCLILLTENRHKWEHCDLWGTLNV